MAVAIELLE
jgi:hypothetical protein